MRERKTVGRGKRRTGWKWKTLWKLRFNSIQEKCRTFYTTGTHSARHQEMQRRGTHSPGVQGAQSWREDRNAQLHLGCEGMHQVPRAQARESGSHRQLWAGWEHTAGKHWTSFQGHVWYMGDKTELLQIIKWSEAGYPQHQTAW